MATKPERTPHFTLDGAKRNQAMSGVGHKKNWRWLAGLFMVAAAMLTATAAHAQQVLYQADFEDDDLLDSWKLTGDWRFKTNSACLPNEFGYISPVTSLVFDYGSECAYRSSRSGLATQEFDINIPIVYPSVKLEWWDFLGAELGSDFAFIDISTDQGATWQELYRATVSQLDQGGVLEMALKYRNVAAKPPRHNH